MYRRFKEEKGRREEKGIDKTGSRGGRRQKGKGGGLRRTESARRPATARDCLRHQVTPIPVPLKPAHLLADPL